MNGIILRSTIKNMFKKPISLTLSISIFFGLMLVLFPYQVRAISISDYQAGYDDGYAAAQVSKSVYAIGDACQNQSTQYCNGFLAGYTTEFFALYQHLPQVVTVHESGPKVVVIHPNTFEHTNRIIVVHNYAPHPQPFIIHQRPLIVEHNHPSFFQHPHFEDHGKDNGDGNGNGNGHGKDNGDGNGNGNGDGNGNGHGHDS